MCLHWPCPLATCAWIKDFLSDQPKEAGGAPARGRPERHRSAMPQMSAPLLHVMLVGSEVTSIFENLLTLTHSKQAKNASVRAKGSQMNAYSSIEFFTNIYMVE